MADLASDPVPDPPDLDPGTLASAGFTRARKGFEPAEVRALLGRASDALRAWKERDDRLVARLDELERRLEQSQELDEQRITTVLGEETARIVAAAREAASEIRTKAEEQAARLVAESEEAAAASATALTDEATALRDEAARVHEEAMIAAEAARSEAQDHADRLRAEASAEHDSLLAAAKTVLDERTAEAEAVAGGIREAAQIELDGAHAEGDRLREEAREVAAAEVERARAEGRAMVEEARQLRRQMLQDLAERRRTARRQIEAARAGRDRIIEALGTAGDRVAQVVDELHGADDQAQRAADAAAAAVDDDIDEVVAELETGLTLGGLPLLEDADQDLLADDIDLSAGASGDSVVVDELAVEEVVIDVGTDEPAAGDGPADAPDVASGPAGTSTAPGSTIVDVDEEPSPGATVHDLFERIRAERRADDSRPSVDAGGAAAVLDDPLDDDTDLDDTDLDDTDLDDRADDGGSGLAPVVVLEPASDEHPAGTTVDASAHQDQDDAIEATAIETTAVETVVAVVDETATADARAATSALDRRDALLASTEKALARSLKRLVSDEQNEVLDRLRRIRRGMPELDVLLPEGEDVATFTDALRADYAAAAAAGLAFWDGESGTEGAADDDRLDAEVVEGGLEIRVGELLGLRRAHIQRALQHAADEGVELAELGDHVRAAYREWRTRSVPELAGDLAASGFALGEQAAAGEGTTWCWMVDNGGLPCSDAEDNALAGAIGCGAAFPTGDVIPPAHSGCRCILVPPPR
jgi:cell division septum initiation protein DivIVA